MRLRLALAFGLVQAMAAHCGAEDSFIAQSFGGRPLGLGSAFSAVADDASALLWNPAGLAQVTQPLVFGSQSHLEFSENVYATAAIVPLGRAGTAGLAVQHLNLQNAALTRPVLDASGNPVLDPATGRPLDEITGFGTENDATILAGWGMSLAAPVMGGGSVKLLIGKAGPVAGFGIGADAGVLVRWAGAWRAGLAVDDLGATSVRWHDGTRTRLEPATRLGLAWNPDRAWLFSAEVRTPVIRPRVLASLGAEWRFADALALRAGVDDARFSAGAGLRMPVGREDSFVMADYAIVTGASGEDRNKVSLTLGW
jgi:hypothetical protein